MVFYKKFADLFVDLDKKTFYSIMILCMFSIFITCSISPAIAYRINVYKFHFAIKHFVFLVLSIGLILSISMLNQDFIVKSCIFGYAVMVFMLAAVLIFGTEIKGAHRWIKVPFITAIQPSEILKPFFIVMNAIFLQNLNRRILFKCVISFVNIGIIGLLLMLEPDFGMFVMYSSVWLAQLFVSGFSLRYLMGVLGGILIAVIIIVSSFSHARQRVLSFVSSKGDSKYQVEKALQALSTGGAFGKGPGDGSIKFQVPDVHTDYVFAAIGEEFGYVVCFLISFIYLFIVIHNLLIAKLEPSMLKTNIIVGTVVMFGLQAFINMGVSIDLLPSKGMTLPFISYGGSAAIGMGISFGILLAMTSSRQYRSRYNLF